MTIIDPWSKTPRDRWKLARQSARNCYYECKVRNAKGEVVGEADRYGLAVSLDVNSGRVKHRIRCGRAIAFRSLTKRNMERGKLREVIGDMRAMRALYEEE